MGYPYGPFNRNAERATDEPKLLGEKLVPRANRPRASAEVLYSATPTSDSLSSHPVFFTDWEFLFMGGASWYESHALADTGAADSFISLRLVEHLVLEQLLRKKPQRIQIADGTVVQCTHFVHYDPHGLREYPDGIFSLPHRLSSRVGNALRTHLLWRQRAMVLRTDGVDHLIQAELLPPPEAFLTSADLLLPNAETTTVKSQVESSTPPLLIRSCGLSRFGPPFWRMPLTLCNKVHVR